VKTFAFCIVVLLERVRLRDHVVLFGIISLVVCTVNDDAINACCSSFLRYDTTEEFNVDSKAECDQLNLAHVARNKKF